MATYLINLLSSLPPALSLPIRFPAGTTPAVKWAFQDVYGNPQSVSGKSIALSVWLDAGGSKVAEYSHSTSDTLAVNGPTVTWQPSSGDVATPGVFE